MRRLALVPLVLCLAGCVQTRPPLPSLEAPRAAVERAETLGADDWAPGELNLARQSLWEAEAALADDASERAYRLAEAVLLHVELAETITLTAQAQEVLEEVQASTRALREEIEQTRPADQ